MLTNLTLLLAMLDPTVGVQARQVAAATNVPTHFTSYTQAYHEAKREKKPLLVILNPTDDAVAVRVDDVRKTEQRRALLEKYVVVVIDTSTKHGETIDKLFDRSEKSLPHVSVIDRDQQWQVFRTSKKLQGEDWTRILETFQNGESTARLNLNVQPYCPTCQMYQYR